jgi:hypothetical protein
VGFGGVGDKGMRRLGSGVRFFWGWGWVGWEDGGMGGGRGRLVAPIRCGRTFHALHSVRLWTPTIFFNW